MHRKQRQAEKAKEEQKSGGRQLSEENERGEGEEKLRWKVHLLEKDKLELTTIHNQELCNLRAELTRLRSSVERGEAQRVELQYQLTVSQRNEEKMLKLTERAAEVHQTVQELQKALELTRQAREEDRHLQQREIEERNNLINRITSENQQLHRLLQDHKDALENSEQRMAELKKESEKEARVKRQLAKEMESLRERESRGAKEKEVLDQRLKSLHINMETEQASHLETKFNSEVLQLRLGDLQAALAVEKSSQQVALHNLELLRAQLREVEEVSSQEKEKSISLEHHLERLQKDFAQYKTDINVILEKEKKMTFDLTEKLENEKRQHGKARTLLEQNRSKAEKAHRDIREALQQHAAIKTSPSDKDVGDQSSADLLQLLNIILESFQQRLEAADQQVHDLLPASERLNEENQSLKLQNSEQSRQLKEAQQEAAMLQEQADSLQKEHSDWLAQVQADLKRNSEERASERVEQAAKVQELKEQLQQQSKDHLSFLYTVYQRLLTGCVLLDQHQSIQGNFTWKELCDVINEHVDQLTSDLRQANAQISHLQSACNKKSVFLRELQQSQECVMSHLAESLRKREEAWSSQHTHTVASLQKELQTCRLKCDALHDHASSLDRRNSSLTSDLARLEGLHSKSQREACSYTAACSLLAGALRHALHRSRLLSEQKRLLLARLDEKEALEEELRRLATALGDEEEEAGTSRRRETVVRLWRRSVWVVRVISRWRSLGRQTLVLFHVEMGGAGPAVGVCGGGAQSAQLHKSSGEGRPSVCPRWLCSKSLSSKILSSMASLQGTLSLSDSSSSPDVKSTARSALSLLLRQFLDQKNVAAALQHCKPEKEALPSSLSKVLVSSLQRHFLLFSQRLHSTEMERRSLRLEVANLRKGRGQHKRQEMVTAEHFNSVRSELRQSLSREREAHTLIQGQSNELRTLQSRLNTHASEQRHLQDALTQAKQSLSELRQEVGRKERSLRILGKHLMVVQRERKQLCQRLQQADGELSDTARQRDVLIASIKVAETSYNQVRETLLQSHSLLAPQLHPSPLQHLEMSLGECIMAGPEVAALQSLLSSFSQLCHSFGARVDWLELEVSTLRSHVMALRSELQDDCQGDSRAFVPISESLENSPDMDDSQCPVPLSNSRQEQYLILSPAPQTIPTSPRRKCPTALVPSKLTGDKTREKRATKKSRVGRQKMD